MIRQRKQEVPVASDSSRNLHEFRLGKVPGHLARITGAIALGAVIMTPFAVQHAKEEARATVDVAGIPAELSLNPSHSTVDLFNQATVTLPKTFDAPFPIGETGVNVELTPPRIDSFEKAKALASPQTIDVIASMADSPNDVVKSYKTELSESIWEEFWQYHQGHTPAMAAALYFASLLRRRGKEGDQPLIAGFTAAGLAACAIAATGTAAHSQDRTWEAEIAEQASLAAYPLEVLKDTELHDATIDNPRLAPEIETAINFALKMKERRTTMRQEYLDIVTPSLQEAIAELPDLKPDEAVAFYMSDMHANTAGIELAKTSVDALRERYGDAAIPAVFNLGDTVYTDLQNSVLDKQAEVFENRVVLTPGNHDLPETREYAEEAGMLVPDGLTEVNGLKVYSVGDPEETPFLGSSRFTDPDVTEQSVGEDAYEQLSEEGGATSVNFHQPRAVQAFMDTPSMSEFLDTPGRLTECDPEENVRDLPAGSVNAGHWHEHYPVRMVCNSDGTWTVINIQGTGGGAIENPTIERWSDPDGKPMKDVSFRAFTINKETGLYTGYIDLVISPEGVVSPVQRVDIGTEDGRPFPVPAADAKKDRPSARK